MTSRAVRQQFRSVAAFTSAQLTTLLSRAAEILAFNQGGFLMEVDNVTRAFRGLYVKGSPGSAANTFVPVATGISELPAPPSQVLFDPDRVDEVVVLTGDGTGGSMTRNDFVTAYALVGLTDAQTLTNKTLTSPTINGGTIGNATLVSPRAGQYLGTAGNTGIVVDGGVALDVPLRFLPAQDGAIEAFIRVSGGAGDNSLRIQAENDGVVFIDRPVCPTGLVAQINGGVGPFANPVTGQFVLAGDATGGPKPAWYDGAAWRTADGVILA